MPKVYIYGLSDPRTGEVKYVGKTIDINRRYRNHINTNDNAKNSKRVAWIKNLKSQGVYPEIFVIEETTEDLWRKAEQYWISYFKSIGCNLKNGTEGGDTLPILVGVENPNYNKPRPPETRRKISEGHIGKGISQEHRRSISKKLKENYKSGYQTATKYKSKYKHIIAEDPNGEKFCILSVFLFCKKFGLNNSNVYKCLKGEIKQYKGWKFSCEGLGSQ